MGMEVISYVGTRAHADTTLDDIDPDVYPALAALVAIMRRQTASVPDPDPVASQASLKQLVQRAFG
jgi:hypothetical protein